MPSTFAEIEIVPLSKAHPEVYFTDIASLHIRQIHHGLLPLLGQKFLSRLYYELAIAPDTKVLGALNSNELVGFICGCADARLSYLSVLSRAWPLFLSLTAQVILKPMLMRRMVNVLYYPFKYKSEIGHTVKVCGSVKSEILSIAVCRDNERQGIGEKLIKAFEAELLHWNNKGYYRVATNTLDDKSNAFYRKVGFTPCHQIRHNDLILQVYLKEI